MAFAFWARYNDMHQFQGVQDAVAQAGLLVTECTISYGDRRRDTRGALIAGNLKIFVTIVE